MTEIITTAEHYDRLIAMDNDPFRDPPELKEYMNRWTGREFWTTVGDVARKDIFEIGIGTGRIASRLLQDGCHSLTGIDISKDTIERAAQNLSSFKNMTLVHADI